MTDLQQLTAAVNEALAMIDTSPEEAAGVLRTAVAEHGYVNPATAVPQSLPIVGVCSSCAGNVVRKPGQGASCPCGDVMIPEHFRFPALAHAG